LLRDGDSLRVQRVVSATELALGDVAIVKRPDGILAAHLVVGLDPLATASTANVRDPLPLEALGRVTGFRRRNQVRPWPRGLSLALRHWPTITTPLQRLKAVRALVRLARGD
jgi:hypothetical protein